MQIEVPTSNKRRLNIIAPLRVGYKFAPIAPQRAFHEQCRNPPLRYAQTSYNVVKYNLRFVQMEIFQQRDSHMRFNTNQLISTILSVTYMKQESEQMPDSCKRLKQLQLNEYLGH
jgi:hypothetical protein